MHEANVSSGARKADDLAVEGTAASAGASAGPAPGTSAAASVSAAPSGRSSSG